MAVGHDSHLVADIRQHVLEALARCGAAGEVTIEGDRVVLVSPVGCFTTPLGACGRNWWEMPPDERRRAATELARRLNDQRRAVPSRPARRPSVAPYVLTGLLLLVLVSAIVAYPVLVRPPSPAASGSWVAAAVESDARSRAACEQSRARVLRGDTLGPLDVDGWVVELSLLRSGGMEILRDPGLRAFVDDASSNPRLVWTGSPELSRLAGPTTRLAVAEHRHADGDAPEWRELTLTFSGRFVDRYFREEERAAFFGLADALTARLAAPYAAVYARCAHRTDDAMVGAWIRGPNVPAAAAALVFFMDVRSSASHVQPPSAPGARTTSPQVLVRLEEAARGLDRRRLAHVLADTSGMLAGGPEGPITVMFPYKDFSRPSRAALQVARQLEVAKGALGPGGASLRPDQQPE